MPLTSSTAGDGDLSAFLDALRKRAPGETVFHDAVEDVAEDIIAIINRTEAYQDIALLERLTEPDRIITFRVTWERDDGRVEVNRGYRVQYNGAIGPYKGGLRFSPAVDLATLKFLGFEQTFKNALTGMPMGGAKGGADLDTKGCSPREIRRFCQAFMMELHRHIGPDVDVPAGDQNVGAREIGWLFGAYRRITNEFDASLTGKGLSFGGSEMRVEATGHGLVHFLCHMLDAHSDCIDDKRVVISGAGNVATHAADKVIELGGRVIALSDSGGCLVREDGFSREQVDVLRQHKKQPGASLEHCAGAMNADWREGETPWPVACDIALPCATQNELGEEGARQLVDNGCIAVAEGANMPCTKGARRIFREAGIMFAPGKAANAGGVAVSGLEISQNRLRRSKSREDIQDELADLMKMIHDRCREAAPETEGRVDYACGANIAGFRKVADAMTASGIH